MILTLTPNPSLDLLFAADRLVWDDANRLAMPRRRPGGQGINVVRAARSLAPSLAARAVAPLGGEVGRDLRQLLEAEGTPLRTVPMDAETRLFVGVRETDSGRSLLLNPRGPTVDPGFGAALLGVVVELLEERPEAPAWVVCCGSLLPGLPDDLYARVGHEARRRGARFVPDCDGAALANAAPAADLLVPNDMEAARLAGCTVASPEQAVRAGIALLERGPRRVVVTLGNRGAVAVTAAGAWWAYPEPPAELARDLAEGSAVGAGDAFLAALLLADLESGGEAAAAGDHGLAEAVAAGTATLLSRGQELVTPEAVRRVRPHVRLDVLAG